MFASFKPIVFALLVASVESKLRSARQLSQEKIGSFTPITQVTDHVSRVAKNRLFLYLNMPDEKYSLNDLTMSYLL